uniref:Transmembrane protein 107 n=1 Tax=Micromonas pusilla TaxID=38833 RepID=A0A7S0NK65_MICPS
MGRVEDVTLPARFITTAAHLIATLTIVYDSSETVKRALGSDLSEYSTELTLLEGMAYTSIFFFCVEFLGMFTGVSLFMPSANVFYIFAHFFGALFTGLFVTLQWDLQAYPWMFTLFSFFPAFTESVIAFLVLRLNIMQFK